MRKIFLLLITSIFAVFLVSLASAQPAFNIQPNTLYNFGDNVNASITLDQGGSFSSYLVCDGITQALLKSWNNLSLGDFNNPLPLQIQLTPALLGRDSALCQIKATLNSNTISSDSFRVSNLIVISLSPEDRVFNPGEQLAISGTAVKENGQNANGTAEFDLNEGNST
ncbi:MAG TPA: hypothetical protein VMC07_02865, partial [Candidatus Omnitrophota bacterium]|nr:hypothetical protein [Candidatus Omnitrophota bacterium]